MSAQVGGLLLAAGAGRRLGTPKALVTFDGELLVDRGVRTLRAGGCTPVVVVLGAAASAVRRQASLPGAEVVENPDWREGMGSSLRQGLAALRGRTEAVVVALVDQPLVSGDTVMRLIDAWAAGAQVAVATYTGVRGNPVLLDAGVWDEAAGYAVGDEGARGFLRDRGDLVTPVPCDDTGAPHDVDTPADLERARRLVE